MKRFFTVVQDDNKKEGNAKLHPHHPSNPPRAVVALCAVVVNKYGAVAVVGKYGHQVEAIAKEVIAYIKKNAQNMGLDMKTVAKYAAVAALGIYGIRKGGFLGSILVSAAASIAAKHLLGNSEEEAIPGRPRKKQQQGAAA